MARRAVLAWHTWREAFPYGGDMARTMCVCLGYTRVGVCRWLCLQGPSYSHTVWKDAVCTWVVCTLGCVQETPCGT